MPALKQANGGRRAMAAWAIDVAAWRAAIIAAAESAQTPAGLRVVVLLAEQLGPWLDAAERPVGGDQGLTLIRGEALVGEDGRLDIADRDADGGHWQPAEIAAQ